MFSCLLNGTSGKQEVEGKGESSLEEIAKPSTSGKTEASSVGWGCESFPLEERKKRWVVCISYMAKNVKNYLCNEFPFLCD